MNGPRRSVLSYIDPRSWTDLGPRLGSAIVLVVVVAASLYVGGYIFAAVVGGVFAGAYREWETMVTLRPITPFGMALVAALFLAAILFPAFGAPASIAVILIAALASLVARGEAALWRAGGLVFLGLVTLCALIVRGTGEAGVLAGIFIGLSVWLTDTGAFFVGRLVGGEKLAPDISPGKTRSGAIGGFVVGVACASIFWYFATPSPLWIGVLLASALSILGQLGDLSESALKRRFKIKDSGDIIPGHGGLMDRLDSLTFALIFLFVVGVLHAGLGEAAAGVLYW